MPDVDAQIGARLKAVLGLDDVSDIISVLKGMPKSELPGYLEAFLGAPDAAAEVAVLLGAQAPLPATATSSAAASKAKMGAAPPPGERIHKKADLDDDPYASVQKQGKKKGGSGACATSASSSTAAAPVVGGATVTRAKPGGKGGKAGGSTTSLGSIDSVLRPGRHPCACNARRHALLYNCLRCGKVVCEQEGIGPCLFCGGDPHEEQSVGEMKDEEAIAKANAFKERLLDFDRASAKRTTVIDDQVDYYSNAASDAWLSTEEKKSHEAAMAAREAEAERKRREVRVTLDFATGTVSRDVDGTAEALIASLAEEDAREADGPCMEPSKKGGGANKPPPGLGAGGSGGKPTGGKGAAVGKPHAASLATTDDALRACSADFAPLPALTNGLINPSLKSRPMFTRGGAGGGGNSDAAAADKAAASQADKEMMAQAMEQGLQYSVARVQHDDDEFLAMLRDPRKQDEGYIERLAAQAQEASRLAENEAGKLLGGGGNDAGASGGAHSSVVVEDEDDEDDDASPTADGRQFCLSMHQPWASLLVAGIKRVEGRGWPTDHRGRLWIASTAREPTDLEVATVEQQYMERFSAVHSASSGGDRYESVMAMQKQVHTFPAFPTSYPPSALLGCVKVADCLSNEEYVAKDPDGEENGSAYVFVCERPRTLIVPIRITGQHKIWTLPPATAASARASLRPTSATWDAKPAATATATGGGAAAGGAAGAAGAAAGGADATVPWRA